MKKETIEFTLGFLVLIALIIFFYAFFAGIWGFNPSNIKAFNIKLIGTSVYIFVFVLLFSYFYDQYHERKNK